MAAPVYTPTVPRVSLRILPSACPFDDGPSHRREVTARCGFGLHLPDDRRRCAALHGICWPSVSSWRNAHSGPSPVKPDGSPAHQSHELFRHRFRCWPLVRYAGRLCTSSVSLAKWLSAASPGPRGGARPRLLPVLLSGLARGVDSARGAGRRPLHSSTWPCGFPSTAGDRPLCLPGPFVGNGPHGTGFAPGPSCCC